MPYGPRRGWSDFISGRQARELYAADAFAGKIGRPLLYRIHLNWSRTALEDDADGSAAAAYRNRIARWLRSPDQGRHALYAIYVRERPAGASAKPNDHIHLHVPADLAERLPAAAADLLPRSAFPLGRKAIVVDQIGWTMPARHGALAYLLKSTAPGAARLMECDGLLAIRPQPQGRVHGKRCGVTENLSRAARERYRITLPKDTSASALVA
ncbi:hypothetical protein ACFZ8E_27280 [Methylobacterium sp. HMF5984]|uniref:hypothetical protein n=1 Tax=Methylobacterium sp. HMF5984 TaxID=3367370 RepID=UPI0038534BC2